VDKVDDQRGQRCADPAPDLQTERRQLHMPADTGPDCDVEEVRALVRQYFGAFTSGPDLPTRMTALRAMFVDNAVIVRASGNDTTVYDVDAFIAPSRSNASVTRERGGFAPSRGPTRATGCRCPITVAATADRSRRQ
jgi:hypothetical protein